MAQIWHGMTTTKASWKLLSSFNGLIHLSLSESLKKKVFLIRFLWVLFLLHSTDISFLDFLSK